MAHIGLHKDMRLVFNPTCADVNLTLLGELILIPVKKSVVLSDKTGIALQELLPGMEYTEMSEKSALTMEVDLNVEPEPIKKVPKEKKTKAKIKKSKKKK